MSDIYVDPVLDDRCGDYLKDRIYEVLFTLGIGIAIIIINLIIRYVVYGLIKAVKYASKSEFAIKRTIFTTIAVYLNTSFVLFLIYFKIGDFSIVDPFKNLFADGFFDFDYNNTGMDRVWYEEVGSKLLVPIILAIFLP